MFGEFPWDIFHLVVWPIEWLNVSLYIDPVAIIKFKGTRMIKKLLTV